MADAEAVWTRVLSELAGREPPAGLREYVGELVTWGERIHLTGREDMAASVSAQISDSLEMLGLAGEGGYVADIGAGAGFPGIVWKLARPSWRIVLFERKERLATFLSRTAAVLGLEGIEARGEDASRFEPDDPFDVVASKAAGRLGEMLPIAGRLLRPGGMYVTVKGDRWESELDEASGFTVASRAPLSEGRGEAIALRFM
jgi:16S rRNA (guanine527-N7)-methyltransferase